MRKFVTIAYLAGSTFGVLAIVVILLGCCVLPFHDRLHRVPLCRTIAAVLSGDHHDREQPAEPAQPAPAKRSPDFAAVHYAPDPTVVPACPRASVATHRDPGARNLVTLGALRVDDDVGLHSLFSTFRI